MAVQPALRQAILPGTCVLIFIFNDPMEETFKCSSYRLGLSLAEDYSQGRRRSQRSKACLPDSRAFPCSLLHQTALSGLLSSPERTLGHLSGTSSEQQPLWAGQSLRKGWERLTQFPQGRSKRLGVQMPQVGTSGMCHCPCCPASVESSRQLPASDKLRGYRALWLVPSRGMEETRGTGQVWPLPSLILPLPVSTCGT